MASVPPRPEGLGPASLLGSHPVSPGARELSCPCRPVSWVFLVGSIKAPSSWNLGRDRGLWACRQLGQALKGEFRKHVTGNHGDPDAPASFLLREGLPRVLARVLAG